MAVAAVALAGSATSQTLGEVEVHGFGGWGYAETDGNGYLIGSEAGNYDNASFALNVAARPAEKLTIVGQAELQQRAGFDELDVRLDYGFAEWRFSDALRLRAGRVKHPFGIYGETFNVGTLRPFFLLPTSIYGPERYTARSVDGMGVTGQFNWSSGWGLQYDVYGGRIAGELRISGVDLEIEETQLGLQSVPFGFDDVIGGRVIARTPIEGLSLGASGYRGVATGFFSVGESEIVVGAHAEYDAAPWLIRAEWGTIFEEPILRFDTYYGETAYSFSNGLQLAVRYERWKGDLDDFIATLVPPFVHELQDHEEWAFGINYWLDPAFVIKLNFHRVEGNRFANPTNPEARTAAFETAAFEKRTNMVVLGAQFSF
jgi:hypothetical protein